MSYGVVIDKFLSTLTQGIWLHLNSRDMVAFMYKELSSYDIPDAKIQEIITNLWITAQFEDDK